MTSVQTHSSQPSSAASSTTDDNRQSAVRHRRFDSAQAREPLIVAEVEVQGGPNEPPPSSEQDEPMDEEMMKYGASHVVRLFIPVSICMSLVVASISAIKYYTVKEPGQFFIYTPFSESSQANSGGIALVSLMNALVFIGVVLVMTTLLIVLYKYRCYVIIHGWLVLSTLLLLFMFAFIYMTEMIKALNLAADWISLCLFIWNFGVAGLCAIHWKAPLHLQQAYHIAMSVLMALVLIKWLPDWTGWVILGVLAVYDLLAVLCPCGPLNILVKTAKERNENVFPALIYSSGMVRVGKPGGRFGESSNSAEPESVDTNSSSPVDCPGNHDETRAIPSESGTGEAEIETESPREQAALLVTMARSPPKPPVVGVSQPRTTSMSIIEANPLSLVVTATDSDEQPSTKQTGSSKQRATRAAMNTSGVLNSAAELDSNTTIEQAGRNAQSRERSRPEQHGSRASTSTAGSQSAATRSTSAAGTVVNEHEQLETGRRAQNVRRTSAAPSEESQQPSEAKDRGVKMGLGDFIFYSVLVGKAAQQSGDWTTTIICFVAILIGLGCTLVLLAIFRRALPALPISIAFGLTFFFASRYVVQPFVDTLAVNQVFI